VIRAWRGAALVLLLGALPGTAEGQGPSTRPGAGGENRQIGRVEIAGGFGLLGGAALGAEDANLRANASPEEPYRLFTATSNIQRAGALEARLGTALTRRFAIEGRFCFSRPELRSSISADVEGAPALTVMERVDQYVIDAAVLVLLDEARFGGVVPFASAGAGYVRQLHEGLTVIEGGRIYHVGGGLKHWFFSRNTGFARAAGARADARLYILSGGIALDDGPRSHGAISGSLFVTF
jgi:hypothetical protein